MYEVYPDVLHIWHKVIMGVFCISLIVFLRIYKHAQDRNTHNGDRHQYFTA